MQLSISVAFDHRLLPFIGDGGLCLFLIRGIQIRFPCPGARRDLSPAFQPCHYPNFCAENNFSLLAGGAGVRIKPGVKAKPEPQVRPILFIQPTKWATDIDYPGTLCRPHSRACRFGANLPRVARYRAPPWALC